MMNVATIDPAQILKEEESWIIQQILLRQGYLKGFTADLNLLYHFPEYASEYFNRTLIQKEILHQVSEIKRLREELERRFIP